MTFIKGNKLGFKKGYIPWNKGKSMPDSMKEKTSQRMIGNKYCVGKKGPWFGKKRSEEDKLKFRISHLGKKQTLEHRMKKASKGEKHWNWQGGITPINMRVRVSVEYKEWRKAVFERDDYTCQECKQRGGDLEAHHVKLFAFFPEFRFSVKNGKTLCKECHRKTKVGKMSKKYADKFRGLSTPTQQI